MANRGNYVLVERLTPLTVLDEPAIDMIALVDDLDAPIAALVQLGGYQYPQAFSATLAHRRFLCYPTAAHRTHHLYLVDEPGELERRLRFRDRLRADPVLANQYAALKRVLAERYQDHRDVYTEAKSEFVKRYVDPRARRGAMFPTLSSGLGDGVTVWGRADSHCGADKGEIR